MLLVQSVANKPIMLSVVMLIVVMLSVVMLNALMPNVVARRSKFLTCQKTILI